MVTWCLPVACRAMLTVSATHAHCFLQSLFAGEDEEENIIAMEQLRDFTTKIFGEFFRAMAEVLGNLAEQPPDLLKALAAFNDNMAEIDSHVPEAKLVEAADKIIWGAIDNRVGSTFTGLEQQASECLKSLERATSAGGEGVAVHNAHVRSVARKELAVVEGPAGDARDARKARAHGTGVV